MVRRLIQLFLGLVLVTGGVTAVAAAPASAAVKGGCSNAGALVQACVSWGLYGDNARADFYLNGGPSSSIYSFHVYLVVDGKYFDVGSGRLTAQGRYCCYYRNTHNMPLATIQTRTVVSVFNSSGILYNSTSSPTITYVN
jgi:hypothetical protein